MGGGGLIKVSSSYPPNFIYSLSLCAGLKIATTVEKMNNPDYVFPYPEIEEGGGGGVIVYILSACI